MLFLNCWLGPRASQPAKIALANTAAGIEKRQTLGRMARIRVTTATDGGMDHVKLVYDDIGPRAAVSDGLEPQDAQISGHGCQVVQIPSLHKTQVQSKEIHPATWRVSTLKMG
jgi:hypothetical protein